MQRQRHEQRPQDGRQGRHEGRRQRLQPMGENMRLAWALAGAAALMIITAPACLARGIAEPCDVVAGCVFGITCCIAGLWAASRP